MPSWRCIVIVLALTGSEAPAPGQAQEPAVVMTTIKGVLISIKGDVYLMQDLSGRFVTFHVDTNTQRQRLVVPGERIEVQLSPAQRAISIKPAP